MHHADVHRVVYELERDNTFNGILSLEALAQAVGAAPRVVRTGLKRMIEDGYVRVDAHAEDYDGGYDLAGPSLTTRGVAALAT